MILSRKAQPRTVKVQDPHGRPVAGARIAPLTITGAGRSAHEEVPETLATQLAVTTGPDGQAGLNSLAGADTFATARFTAHSIGTQHLYLFTEPARNMAMTIRLGPRSDWQDASGTATGSRRRTRSRGLDQGAAWCGRIAWFSRMAPSGPRPTAVRDARQPAGRGDVHGRGSYPGVEPVFSGWITIGKHHRSCCPCSRGPCGQFTGGSSIARASAIGRRGLSVGRRAGADHDANADRRPVRAEGLSRGVGVSLRAVEGYRYFGKLIKPGEQEITARMTRIGEHPAPEMHTLPEPVPREEAQALTRRLIEPCWDAVAAQKYGDAPVQLLVDLAYVDPIDALQKLETEDAVKRAGVSVIIHRTRVSVIKSLIVRVLAREGSARAEKVAESIDSPTTRSCALGCCRRAAEGKGATASSPCLGSRL